LIRISKIDGALTDGAIARALRKDAWGHRTTITVIKLIKLAKNSFLWVLSLF